MWDKHVRDLVIFAVAIGGIANQAFFAKDPSEALILALAGLLGIPPILAADERRRNNGGPK